MNTKFFFVLLATLIVLILAACAPAITGNSAPIDPVQPADNELLAPVPTTGNSATESVRTESEPRLWSGEAFLSDNGNPDYVQNVQPAASQKAQDACISEDSLLHRYGGCVE